MEKWEDDLLFHVFKAETGAKNDVWRKSQLKRHPYISNEMLGKTKWRYTVPLLLLGKAQTGERVYFMIHTSTAKINLNNFVIKAENFTKNLGAKIEYIYFFNARIGLSSEFKTDEKGNLLEYGTVKDFARASILSKSLNLIKGTPREEIINDVINKRASIVESNLLYPIVWTNQFSKEEKVFRDGNKKRYHKRRNK